MDLDSAAFKISGMRQGKYIFQVFPPDVPVGPVGNLHLAVRPLRRVFSLQVFEVFLFVSPDDGLFRNLTLSEIQPNSDCARRDIVNFLYLQLG